MMKQLLYESDLDMEKMPLGKISKKQIQEAMSVLNEISNLIEKGASSSEFVEASNRFYTLIPHDFGVKRPPVIDTVEKIVEKNQMLMNLIEMELAYGLLNQDTDSKKNPIDGHYEQLKTDIEPIEHDSKEFKILRKYIKNTHAPTHANYELEIEDIFKVSRWGEDRRFKAFKKLQNRQLLWHGSRLTNYVGILSHGLKVAPPDAPPTGYMFGKGIYFSDIVSKSANYCATSKENSTGLLLLCEVALGETLERNNADFITELPTDKHSVKAVGKTFPDPKDVHEREDGVIIPWGNLVTKNTIRSPLLYNEYVVYDASQVKIEYLVKLNFKYKH